jgi:hypothetical protein
MNKLKLVEGEPLKVEDLDLSGIKVIRYETVPADPAWANLRGPTFRSCWECNPAHEHLKSSKWLVCFVCGNSYRLGVKDP